MKRAALLIGVQNANNLPALQAVYSGVDRMENWARTQGMDAALVRTLTDANGGEVRAHEVEDAVNDLISVDGVEQLIIYFAGHGVNISYNEYWLLSRAMASANESINVFGSLPRARLSGVDHVVLFSDACRSTPQSFQGNATTGSIIFPNKAPGPKRSKVDIFYATALGDPALEVKNPNIAANRFQAVFTESLLEAFNGIQKQIYVRDDNLGVDVLRPWKLHDFLEIDVPSRVFELTNSFTYTQNPDSTITSRPDKAWISDISKTPPAANTPFEASEANATAAKAVFDDRSHSTQLVYGAIAHEDLALNVKIDEIREAALARAAASPPGAGGNQETSVDFANEAKDLAEPFGPEEFESRCGFKVRGDKVVEVVGAGNNVEIRPDRESVGVFVDSPKSVLIVLESGFGVLAPAFPGYIGSLIVHEASLNAVFFEPSRETYRWDVFEGRKGEIRTLRSVAAAASRRGVFKLHGESASKIARRMQLAKGVDPSLALYAAHAYFEQANDEYLSQMAGFVRSDQGKVPFDIALLNGELNDTNVVQAADRVVPFLPLFSQTWAMLPAFNVELPDMLKDIQTSLSHHSLWSLYAPSGVDLLRHALQSGAE